MPNEIHAWNGSSWAKIDDPKVWDGGWVPLQKAYVYNGSSWEEVWSRSDPVTQTLDAVWTQTYMQSGERAVGSILSGLRNTDLGQGVWSVSQGDPAGTWNAVTGAMSFNGLAALLNDRPVIKNASLRLSLITAYGGTPYETRVSLGVFDVDGGGSPTILDHTDANKDIQNSGNDWTNPSVKTVALNSAMLGALETKHGIVLHDVSHADTEVANRQFRAFFDGNGAADGLKPKLTVTVDYV